MGLPDAAGEPPITATLTWQGDLRFRAVTGQNEIIFDSDSDAGPSPPQAVAMALAGCMAIDVADIVIKGRHPLDGARGAHHRRARAGAAAPLHAFHAPLRGHRRRARRTRSSARFNCRATSTVRCGTRCGKTRTLDTTFEVVPAPFDSAKG